MDRASSYNIITGEIKKEYPMNSTSKRFSSLSQIRRAKQNGEHIPPIPKVRKLGTSTDAKSFIYNHEGGDPQKYLKTVEQTQLFQNGEKKSLINASKLPYNPITHAMTYQQSDRWQNARRLAPFSKQTHMGRFNAPNYSKEFAEKLNTDVTNFHRKRSACTQLCQIQKSYGVGKFFRKYK